MGHVGHLKTTLLD